LQVEYLGPQVGMADMDAEHVYRLAIREHGWDALTRVWGLKVCDALENCDLRPMWPIQGVGRLRKHQVLETLPECLRGYLQAVRAAGLQDRAEAQRLAALSAALSAPA
jgi:hypothetical protein